MDTCPVYGMPLEGCPIRKRMHTPDDMVCTGKMVAQCEKDEEEDYQRSIELLAIDQDHRDAIEGIFY